MLWGTDRQQKAEPDLLQRARPQEGGAGLMREARLQQRADAQRGKRAGLLPRAGLEEGAGPLRRGRLPEGASGSLRGARLRQRAGLPRSRNQGAGREHLVAHLQRADHGLLQGAGPKCGAGSMQAGPLQSWADPGPLLGGRWERPGSERVLDPLQGARLQATVKADPGGARGRSQSVSFPARPPTLQPALFAKVR